jgi:pimeloyl-ACP methyl ester carboxylesterase
VIAAFVDTLALSGFTLVAHDWGGPIGLATVEEHPALPLPRSSPLKRKALTDGQRGRTVLLAGREQRRRAVGFIAEERRVLHVQASGQLVGYRGEHLRRVDPSCDECRHLSQRSLLLRKHTKGVLTHRDQPLGRLTEPERVRDRIGGEVDVEDSVRRAAALPGLDPAVRTELAGTVRRVVGKLLHTPTVRIQQLASADGGKAYADALRDLFELDPRATAAITTPLHGAS